MFKLTIWGILLVKIVSVLTKEPDLPLCPTNVLYFPQNLPMHCRMPTNADISQSTGTLPAVPQFPQSIVPNKNSPIPIPIPISPGVPGQLPIPGPMSMSGPMPMPGSISMPGPIAIPGPIGPSAPIPFQGPLPLAPGPAHKLPVIVMPFYSPDTSFKKGERLKYPQHSYRPRKRKIRHKRRRPHIYSSPDTSGSTDMETSSEASSSASSEYQGWWKGRRSLRRFHEPIRMKKRKRYQKRQLLTPVLQYVTKDGYVIFEKKISKNEAKDWLNVKKDGKIEVSTRVSPEAVEMQSSEAGDNHTGEKEMITEDNVEDITKRNIHRLRIKSHRDKAVRKKNLMRSI